jgi:tetratricopeptide (TPR) repeat protein
MTLQASLSPRERSPVDVEKPPPNPDDLEDGQQTSSMGTPSDPRVSEADRVGERLERGKRLVQEGELVRARSCLEGILGPVIDRPWALEIWVELTRLLDPLAEQGLQEALGNWVRKAREILEDHRSLSKIRVPSKGLHSRTIAGLYWDQGHREKAIEIYRALLRRDPEDIDLLKEFEMRLTASHGVHHERAGAMRTLEGWTARIRRRREELVSAREGRRSGG